jgi:hypothetical protein
LGECEFSGFFFHGGKPPDSVIGIHERDLNLLKFCPKVPNIKLGALVQQAVPSNIVHGKQV